MGIGAVVVVANLYIPHKLGVDPLYCNSVMIACILSRCIPASSHDGGTERGYATLCRDFPDRANSLLVGRRLRRQDERTPVDNGMNRVAFGALYVPIERGILQTRTLKA